MGKYLRKFQTQAEYEAAAESLERPNVSLIEEGRVLFFNASEPGPEPVETRVICVYSAVTTEEPTQIFSSYSDYQETLSSMEVDGELLDEMVDNYVFDTTGEHIVKFELIDETTIGTEAFYRTETLVRVTIPNNVTYIGSQAFDSCDILEDVYYNGTMAEWENVEKESDWVYYSNVSVVHCTDGDVKAETTPSETQE